MLHLLNIADRAEQIRFLEQMEKESRMPDYLVTWEININAESPEAAAAKALEIQRDPNSIATVFDVTDEDGRTARIDLESE